MLQGKGAGVVELLNKVVKVSLTELIFKRVFEKDEGTSHASISTKSITGRENSKYKDTLRWEYA